MFRENSDLKTPNGNTIIWRYMSLDKFFDLIYRKTIFLNKIINLSDKYEGKLPEKKYYDGIKFNTQSGLVDSTKLKKRRQQEFTIKYAYGINCWSISKNEDYALWKIYTDNMKSGVAIKSTVGRLKKSIKSKDDFFIGQVRYGESFFNIDEPSDLQIICSKRKYYKYENELRLIVKDSNNPPEPSLYLDVDLDILIDEIYLSPFIKEGFKAILESYNPLISKKIRTSDIKDH